MDLLSSNSENTFDKTINCTLRLYTSNTNDTITINYDDGLSQTIQLNSSIKIH